MDDLVGATSRGSQTPESVASNQDSDDSDSSRSPSIRCGTGSQPPLHDIYERLLGLESELDTSTPTNVESQEPPMGRNVSRVGTFPASSTPEMVPIGRVALVSEVHDSAFIRLDVTQPNGWQNAIPLDDLVSVATHIETTAKDTAVQTTTANGGTISGILSGTPSYIRLPHTRKFRQVYTAKLDRPLAPGDCGSWVRDASTGRLFGHVVAGSPTTGLAMVLPAIDALIFAREALQRSGLTEVDGLKETIQPAWFRPVDELSLSTLFVGQGRSTNYQNSLSYSDTPLPKPPTLFFIPMAVLYTVMDLAITKGLIPNPLPLLSNYALLAAFGLTVALVPIGVHIWKEIGLSIPRYRPSQVSTPRSGGDKNYLEFMWRHRGRRPRPILRCFATLTCFFYGLVFVTGNAIQFGLYLTKAADPSANPRDHRAAVISVAIAALTVAAVAGKMRLRPSRWQSVLLATLKAVLLFSTAFLILFGITQSSGNEWRTTYEVAPSAGAPLCLALATDPNPAIAASYIRQNRKSTSYIFRNSASLFCPATPPFATRCRHAYETVALDAGLQSVGKDLRLQMAFYVAISIFTFGSLLTAIFTAARIKQQLAKEEILPGAPAFPKTPPWLARWQRLWLQDAVVFRWLVVVFLILLIGLTVDFEAEYDARAYTYTGIADILVGVLPIAGAVCLEAYRRLRSWGRNTTSSRPPNSKFERFGVSDIPRSWLSLNLEKLCRVVDFRLPVMRWAESARTSLWRTKGTATRVFEVARMPYIEGDDMGNLFQTAEIVSVDWRYDGEDEKDLATAEMDQL
ncbi:hypothetical protein B0T16DRAFT_450700 [Cercophora newfieldiana]|uniref:Uncharacterized protein n=1 Tax=Cercophora newfieldiana TaxID=92897 RepID=A0AA40CZI0_9PEZI|nr:hypothetical protein B0T16DRAFT_450700 [Cercophora newfieldiana]